MTDIELMRHALSLSLKYKYTAKPNPTVGALIYDGNKIVAEGHFVHVYVNRKTRKPTKINSKFRDILQKIHV